MGKDSSLAIRHNFIARFQVSETVGLKKSRPLYRSDVCWNTRKERQSGFRNSYMNSKLGRKPTTKRCQPPEAACHRTLGHEIAAESSDYRRQSKLWWDTGHMWWRRSQDRREDRWYSQMGRAKARTRKTESFSCCLA